MYRCTGVSYEIDRDQRSKIALEKSMCTFSFYLRAGIYTSIEGGREGGREGRDGSSNALTTHDNKGLQSCEANNDSSDAGCLPQEQGAVDGETNSDEKEAKQDAAEWCNVCLHLVTVLSL